MNQPTEFILLGSSGKPTALQLMKIQHLSGKQPKQPSTRNSHGLEIRCDSPIERLVGMSMVKPITNHAMIMIPPYGSTGRFSPIHAD